MAPPAVTVQMFVVLEVNVTSKDEVEDALSEGVVPKFCAPGFAKVIVCAVFALFVSENVPDASEPELAVTL